MKSNTLVYVGLLCAIFLVVSWTAAAGRAQPETKVVQGKPAVVQEKVYGVGGGSYGCLIYCSPFSCGCGRRKCCGPCRKSAEEAEEAFNATKPYCGKSAEEAKASAFNAAAKP